MRFVDRIALASRPHSPLLAFAVLAAASVAWGADPIPNSVGMKLLPIPAGEFIMGSDQKPGNWDELPKHSVTLSKPFLISQNEVTAEQYHQFKPGAPLNEKYAPYAAGISWNDAVAYCQWLSQKEGKHYRLPTEAEWEYAARAGRADGATWEAKAGEANPWGLQDMLTGPVEWCSDWYGEYDNPAQRDPVGYSGGFVKSIRGGYLDTPEKSKPADYLRPSARAGAPPAFGPYADGQPNPQGYGLSRIGFRVVQADEVATPPTPYLAPYVRQGVKQSTNDAAAKGPDPSKPYFHRRRMLPIPPEDERDQALINRTGLHPSFRFHNHSPGFEILPNGDALLVIYTSYTEYEPEVSLMSCRLRAGAEEWDMPSPFMDTPGANDHAPLLKVDGSTLRLFWGNPYAEGHFPFQFIVSTDNGGSWSAVHYPHITGPLGPLLERPQPINTVVRDNKGTMYVAVDAAGDSKAKPAFSAEFAGAHAMLWATDDNGLTWRDTLGRTFGRHTTFTLGKDGSTLIGYGGKNAGIDNFMAKSVSTDGGKTYTYSKTPFSQLNSGQRPSLLRLADGHLFMTGDYQPSKSTTKPASIKENGSYVAISSDEGEHWHIKTLPGAYSEHRKNSSVGYSVARQGPDGTIHLITSLNHPALHFEMNEAWIMSDQTFAENDPRMDAPTATSVANVQSHVENYPDGTPHITWSSGPANDGRIVLDGTETWYYPSGAKQHETTYRVGQKTGHETYWLPDGTRQWEWNHQADGTSLWITYWSDGAKRSESTWKNHELVTGTEKFFDHAPATAAR
jgi:formylglycine-generating enzyme required for sulfatase activity